MMITISVFVALVIGIGIGAYGKEVYLTKKICRECRRTIVEHGFHSGGKEYVAVPKDEWNKKVSYPTLKGLGFLAHIL